MAFVIPLGTIPSAPRAPTTGGHQRIALGDVTFFNSDDGTFILVVKKAIRQAEGVGAGDPVRIVLELLL